MQIVRVVAYTVLSSCIWGTAVQAAASDLPAQETQFCKLIADFMEQKRAYSTEANPLRKAAMRGPDATRAEAAVKELFQPKNNEFTDWIGELRFAVVGQSVSVIFNPQCGGGVNNWLITFRNSIPMSGLPPESSQTIILVNSHLGTQLRGLPASAGHVRVSGHLVPFSRLSKLNSVLSANPNRGPVTYRASNGISGASVDNPNYLVKFESISAELPNETGAVQTNGTLGTTKVLSASYDVLGLRPGMGRAEVDQILRTKFGPSVNITTLPRRRRYTNGPDFVTGESLHTEQLILMLSYAEVYPGLLSAPEVLWSIDYEPNLDAATDKADFVKRVVEKFGQPARIFDQQEYYWATRAYISSLAFDQSDGPVLHLTTYKPALILSDTSIPRRMDNAFDKHPSAAKPPL